MRRGHLLLLSAAILATLTGPTGAAWAGGGSPQGPTFCIVDGPGAGALAIRGTVHIQVTGLSSATQEVDFTLRLERSGVLRFFRLHLVNQNIAGMTNEQVVCVMLGSDNGVLVQQIFDAFAPGKGELVITDKSITRAEDLSAALPLFDSNHAGTMADITLYAR